MKTISIKSMLLAVVMTGLFVGCSESTKAVPFGPIPNDKGIESPSEPE